MEMELWPAVPHVTRSNMRGETVPSQWVSQASLTVSISTTSSQLALRAFSPSDGGGRPGSLFIIWPESQKGSPFLKLES